MSKYQLFGLLATKGMASLEIKGVKGYLMSVEREDGSGRSFCLRIRTEGGEVRTVYVRTVD